MSAGPLGRDTLHIQCAVAQAKGRPFRQSE
jgi:hypothetical protein